METPHRKFMTWHDIIATNPDSRRTLSSILKLNFNTIYIFCSFDQLSAVYSIQIKNKLDLILVQISCFKIWIKELALQNFCLGYKGTVTTRETIFLAKYWNIEASYHTKKESDTSLERINEYNLSKWIFPQDLQVTCPNRRLLQSWKRNMLDMLVLSFK